MKNIPTEIWVKKIKRESQKKKYKRLKEKQIRITHFCPIRSTKLKRMLVESMGERVLFYYMGGNINWYISGSQLEMYIYFEPLVISTKK